MLSSSSRDNDRRLSLHFHFSTCKSKSSYIQGWTVFQCISSNVNEDSFSSPLILLSILPFFLILCRPPITIKVSESHFTIQWRYNCQGNCTVSLFGLLFGDTSSNDVEKFSENPLTTKLLFITTDPVFEKPKGMVFKTAVGWIPGPSTSPIQTVTVSWPLPTPISSIKATANERCLASNQTTCCPIQFHREYRLVKLVTTKAGVDCIHNYIIPWCTRSD